MSELESKQPKPELTLVVDNPLMLVTTNPDQQPQLSLVENYEEVVEEPLPNKRPLLQSLWENKLNIISAANLLLFTTGAGLIISDLPPLHSGLAIQGLKLALPSAALFLGAELARNMKEPTQIILGKVYHWWAGEVGL